MRQYTARIVGFALDNCKACHGTGRVGFVGPMEKGVVNPCICVVSFETSTLLKEAEDAQQAKQRDGGSSEAHRREGDSLPIVPPRRNESAEGRK